VNPIIQVVLLALIPTLVVAAAGWGMQYGLHRRSISTNVSAVALTAVLAVTAGVVASASAMFLSRHDLEVLLVILGVAGLVDRTVSGTETARSVRGVSEAET